MSTTWIATGKSPIDWKIIKVWFVINLIFVMPSSNEIYTSVENIQQSISVENELLRHLRIYIEDETLRLNDLKRFFAKVSGLHNEVYSGSEPAIANPLVAFTLIKRLQSEWMNIVYSNEAKENAQAFRIAYEKEEANLPKFEDLQGAAKGLMRLQDVYALRVDGLVNGHFQTDRGGNTVDVYRPAVSNRLSGDDCFLVGKVAYEQEDYYHSVQWLEEAARLFRGEGGEWTPENEGTLEDALDHLAFSHFKAGNVSYALRLSQELLRYGTFFHSACLKEATERAIAGEGKIHLVTSCFSYQQGKDRLLILTHPSNRRVLRNVEKYEKLLVKSPALNGPEIVMKRPNTTFISTRSTYEWLCQTLGSQPKHHENPRLFCDYFTNGSPALLLQPMRREVVSLYPYVVLYHSFVTSDEAKSIRAVAQPALRRSVVASGEQQAAAEYRISKSAWLKNTAHTVVGRVDQRISALTGLNLQQPYAEHLQVVNYGIGGHYEPHFDHATSASSPLYKLKTGNRVATFMIYLSSVEAGGSTAFIYANFSIPVVKNAALFWWNLHKNGEGNWDTLHAGCPVLVGDKWVANKWVHEHGQEFHRPCSPNPAE